MSQLQARLREAAVLVEDVPRVVRRQRPPRLQVLLVVGISWAALNFEERRWLKKDGIFSVSEDGGFILVEVELSRELAAEMLKGLKGD